MAEFRLPGALQPGLALHRRVAGEGWGLLSPPDLRHDAAIRRRSAPRALGSALRRQGGLGYRSILALFFFAVTVEAQVLSTRIWPAQATTPALTIESQGTRSSTPSSASRIPERLVLDLETNELPPALAELNGKVAADDPYIEGLRVARNRPGVRPPGARPQGRGEAADLHSAADRRLRPPPGARHPSAGGHRIRCRAARSESEQCRRRLLKPGVARHRHHRHRRRARRRGSGRARPPRLAREGHHAQ